MARTLVLRHIAFDAGVEALSCDRFEKKLEERLREVCFTETIAEGTDAVLKEFLAMTHPETVTFEAILPCRHLPAAAFHS